MLRASRPDRHRPDHPRQPGGLAVGSTGTVSRKGALRHRTRHGGDLVGRRTSSAEHVSLASHLCRSSRSDRSQGVWRRRP